MKGKNIPGNRLPRHAAGSFELKEGTGPITTMCSCGTFLEVYKQDRTFRVETPESIDPDEINPNAPWVASAVSDVGSSNMIVARILLQGSEMLKGAPFDPPVDRDAVTIHLHSCKETLLACEKVAVKITSNIDHIIHQITESGLTLDNGGRTINHFPQAIDLESDCGAFLIQANRVIKLICELPKLFYSLDRPDSSFDHLAKRLAIAAGEGSPLTTFVRDNADGIKYLIDLRNFHEHPKQLRTVIDNFRVLPDCRIQAPMWSIAGDKPSKPRPIKEEMNAAVVFLRDTAEALLIHLVMQRLPQNSPYILEEIPKESIDPAAPIKYRLSIDFGKLTFTK